MVQAGLPGVANQSSYGLLAPRGTPKAVIQRVAETTRALLNTSDYQKLLIDIGFEATPDSGPKEFRKTLAEDVALDTHSHFARAEDRVPLSRCNVPCGE